MKKVTAAPLLLLFLFAISSWADVYTVGSSTPSFASGTYHTTGEIPNNLTAPFGSNNPCGIDSNSGPNCDATWTFTYTPYTTVTSASITLGILGLDSATTGHQVALFSMTNGAGEDFTATFENVAEPVSDGGAGTEVSGRSTCPNPGNPGHTLNGCAEYNIYTFDFTSPAALTTLEGGAATFHLELNGSGYSLFGTHQTTDNGATLDFSSLNIQGSRGTPPPPMPEPTTLILLGTGLSGLSVVRRFRK